MSPIRNKSQHSNSRTIIKCTYIHQTKYNGVFHGVVGNNANTVNSVAYKLLQNFKSFLTNIWLQTSVNYTPIKSVFLACKNIGY